MKILITGESRTARFVVRHLRSVGHEVSCLVADDVGADALVTAGARLVIVGGPTDPRALERAAVREADAVLGLSARDEQNLLTCQLARRLYGVHRTLAVANDPENEPVFRRLGVDVVLAPVSLLLAALEQGASVHHVLNLATMADGSVIVSEIVVGEDSAVVGRQLAALDLPEAGLVACVVRGGRAIVPRGGTALQAGDRLVVVALAARAGEVMAALSDRRG